MDIDLDKLAKVLALAGSGQDGEARAALARARGMLAQAGLSFTDLAAVLHAAGLRPAATRRDQSFRVGDFRWESREAYEQFCARMEAERDEQRRRNALERAAVLAKYGNEAAAVARDAREEALHRAARPWLEGPFDADPGDEHLTGRWHERMGGWQRHMADDHPAPECRAAIEAALPWPRTVREARAELNDWNARDLELCHALESWGEEHLDLPASYRRERVRRLYEMELPIVTLDDLYLRLQLTMTALSPRALERQMPLILAAFERLVLDLGPAGPSDEGPVGDVRLHQRRNASTRRQAVLLLLATPATAALSNREIARRVGVSPQTVGNLRHRVRAAG